jgi:hypothetical protein
MQMRYNGGGCYGTSFRRCPEENPDYCTCTKDELPCSEWNNANTCEDFTVGGSVCNTNDDFCADQSDKSPTPGCGPPASTVDHTVYIEAYGKDELYFSGPVRVNSTWDALTEGEKVEANTDIFTYEWIEGVGKGRMLQHVVFHSSCSQDMSITDQFGSQQLVEFDSFCDVSCSDGGCKEVTENGNTFGRRRISLFFESVTKLYLGLEAGSASDSVQLDQVIGLYTPDDFSSATQFFNFSDAIGKVLPPSLTLDPSDLEISPKKNYTIGAIVTGFLDGDTSTPCQQIGQSRLTCQKVEAVPCECPPCSTGEDSGKDGKGARPTEAPSKDIGNDPDNGKDAKKKSSTIPFDGK